MRYYPERLLLVPRDLGSIILNRGNDKEAYRTQMPTLRRQVIGIVTLMGNPSRKTFTRTTLGCIKGMEDLKAIWRVTSHSTPRHGLARGQDQQ